MEKTQDGGNSLRERLIDELNYQNISYKAFATKIGISMSTLNMYLYRNSMPSADIAVKMARALHTTVEYLVTGERRDADTIGKKQIWQWQKQTVLNIMDTFTETQLASFLKIVQAFSEAVTNKTGA
ncbi:MAG: helix-turn-helix transcriptional regulator [Treponema sp.]|nr:helix-turn-helix transcriptional regulator [Treponema sp.]MBD5412881.1 helix-turn-helix transcriptional regulator [Treponema sp.]MBD5443830.1 helix-turn-helix transcriptional regulator [Treponema sp.]